MIDVKNERFNVTGTVRVEIDEMTSNITGTGNVIDIELSLVDKILTHWGRKLPQKSKNLSDASEVLKRTGLTVRVLNNNTPIVIVGEQAKPGLLNKIFKSRNIQWKPNLALIKFALKHKKQKQF